MLGVATLKNADCQQLSWGRQHPDALQGMEQTHTQIHCEDTHDTQDGLIPYPPNHPIQHHFFNHTPLKEEHPRKGAQGEETLGVRRRHEDTRRINGVQQRSSKGHAAVPQHLHAHMQQYMRAHHRNEMIVTSVLHLHTEMEERHGRKNEGDVAEDNS